MRAEPEMTAASSPNFVHHTAANSCSSHDHGCKWWPYSNSNDFGANTAMILIILLCALICALILNTAIRCFLRGANRREVDDHSHSHSKPATTELPLVVAPTLVYSKGMQLGGAEADCAICLSEFLEGEGIQVLGSCKHGFHAHCIEQWLSSHSSCPTCRRSCLASFTTDPPQRPTGTDGEIPQEHIMMIT